MGYVLFNLLRSDAIVCANLGLSGNFVTCSKEYQLWKTTYQRASSKNTGTK